MKLILLTLVFFTIISTGFSQENNTTNKKENQNQPPAHKITVKEVVQVSSYTYLRVDEEGTEKWIAISKLDANVGDIFYYLYSMELQNFESKELKKKFDKITFLESISKDPTVIKQTTTTENQNTNSGFNPNNKQSTKGKEDKKISVKVTPASGAITIAELYSNLKKYEGKTVKITAQITKYNAAILNKNWIHLQDGTDNNGKFDLTATIVTADLIVGSVITIEGKITLNKDFGYGYVYEVILEDAVIK